MSSPPSTPPSTRRSLTDSFYSPAKATSAKASKAPYGCGKYFTPGLMHCGIHLLALMAINGSIAYGVNTFKGGPSIPIRGALLNGAVQAVTYFTINEGRSWGLGYSIRYFDSLLTLEKIKTVALSVLLAPPLTYYGVQGLLHQKIHVLPTLIFSGLGGLTLSVLELIFADHFKPK